ncbi:MAG: hypothetical protein WDZ79_00155 [Candidatus Paceibacterota bacterium]
MTSSSGKNTDTLWSELQARGIRYCHWKSNEHLAEALRGETDLDILADGEKHEEVREVMEAFGWKRVESPPRLRFHGVEDWIGLYEASGSLFHIHLHYKLITGKKFVKEQLLPWEELMLSTRVWDEHSGIFVAEPNLEVIILALRVGIKTKWSRVVLGGRLPENIGSEIEYLKERTSSAERERVAKVMFGDADGAVMARLVEGLIESPVRLTSSRLTVVKIKWFVLTRLYSSRRHGVVATHLLYWLNALRAKFIKLGDRLGATFQNKKTLTPQGAVIALVGADGAGKSTLARELESWFAWKLDTHLVYLGQRKNAFTRILKLISFDLWAVYLARVKYRVVRKAYRLRARGSIVIADRYPQITVAGINDGPLIQNDDSGAWLHRTLRRYEQRVYTKIRDEYPPDVVVKLHVSPEVALARKGNRTPESVQRKTEIIKELSFPDSVVLDIDASEQIERVVMEVKRRIWTHL